MSVKYCFSILRSLLFVGVCTAIVSEDGIFSPQSRLIHQLLGNRNTPVKTIPKPENSGPTVVGIGMTLQQIINVDAKSEQLTTSLYMTYTWHDDRLTWTPEQFDGIKLTRIAVDRIWNPNVILENSLTHEMSESLRVNALVKFNGDVEWLPPAIYRSSCAIDISLFPFDWQNCSMVFRSASYDQSQFIFNFSYGNEVYVDENVFVPNGEWDLLQKPITLSAHDDGKFQRARFSFVIKRRPQFYVLNLILPCVMLSILSCFVFYMPLVAGEKIGLAISLLLGYTVFVFLIAQVMPSTSLRIPILSTFLIFNILTLFASMFGGTLVYNFHFRSMRTHKMPKQLKRFVFEVIGPCVGLRKPDIKWAATSARNRTDVGNGKSKLLENAKNLHRDISASPSNTIFHSQATRYGFGSRRFSAKPADTYPVLVKNAPVELRPTFNFFNFITGRIRIQRHSEIITDDWIFFALILDRICFWIYLVTMIIGLLGFYVTILIIEYPKLL